MKTKNQKQPYAGKGLWAKSVKACSGLGAKLTQLREQLILTLGMEARTMISEPLARQALKEAEAIAYSTKFPLLFLPVLAQEKVLTAREWERRQRAILERQRELRAILN